jgi:thiol-disulfide isomerase/thioredoxin
LCGNGSFRDPPAGKSTVATNPDSVPSDRPKPETSHKRGNLAAWLVFFAAAIAVGIVFEMSGGEEMGVRHPAVGHRLPHLELKPLTGNGKAVTLADLDGKVTLIDYWGTWCPPCAEEFPHIATLAAKYRDRPDFSVLAVSCGGRSAERFDEIAVETEAFLQSFKIDMPTYKDPGGFSRRGVDMVAGFAGYPTTIVLDRQGVIRGMWVGYRQGYERQIEKLVGELLETPATPAGK